MTGHMSWMTVKHLEQYLAQKAIYIVGGSDSLQSFKQAVIAYTWVNIAT